MKIHFAILLIFLMLHVSNGAKKAIKDLGNDVHVIVSMPNPTQIEFSITSLAQYWIRFELGFTQRIFTVSGELDTIEDQNRVGNLTVQTDMLNDYTMLVSGSGPKTYMVVRNMNPLDSSNLKILDGELNIKYLYGNGAHFSEESTVSEGDFTVLIRSKVRDVFLVHSLTRKLDGEGSSADILLHGLFTYFAWDIFSMFLILSGRYSKYFYLFRMYAHTTLGFGAMIFNIIGVGYGAGPTDSVNALGDSHTSIGGLVTVWAIVTV
jgi:hypothetical protein